MSATGTETSINTLSMLSSYVPRQCGIATFTNDLRRAIGKILGDDQATVLAMDDCATGYNYPDEVRFQIQAEDLKSYKTAAELLNINQIDVTVVQHEYGIYGGTDGSHVLELLNDLRMPKMATLHTILTDPSPGQRSVMKHLTRGCDRLVVMSHLAEQILQDVYDTPKEKIAYIPHGIHDVPFIDPNFYKDQFGVEGRTVMLTFGLLSPGKGIEVAIESLPPIVERFPNLMYVILGATHPHILKREGNAYRHSLERLAKNLGVWDNVVFHNKFVSVEELTGYLGAADVYVIPYPNKAQITSGTLSYAMGAGNAVVSTPFWHAEELLADGRGRMFPFGDSARLSEIVIDLLANETERHAMRKRAYMHCRSMVWSQVAQQYVDLAAQIHQEWARDPRAQSQTPIQVEPSLPAVKLTHLRRLTDDTGIMQHAIYATPDRHHGYSIDDVARALIVVIKHYELFKEPEVLELEATYLAFIHHAFNSETGRFRNFMSYDRKWLEDHHGSEDSHGRTIWALGVAAASAPDDAMLALATRLFEDALESAAHMQSPRAKAFVIIGMHAYLQRFGGDTSVRRLRTTLARSLHEQFVQNSSSDWPWCEDILSYCNAKLAHALILSGQWIPDSEMVEQGLRSLEWLVDLQLDSEGIVSTIGNDGWYVRGGKRARFDQQAIEAQAMIEACAEAYRCTQEPIWVDRAHQFIGWFTGHNDTQSVLYDYATGGCRDGLHADGPNSNEGAESTLAWLISLLSVIWLDRHRPLIETANEEEEAKKEEKQ
jgi:glycosyltransferase involved in cell wall biosynthesis